MKVAILGFGDQGRAALEYWGPKNDITICDQNEDLKLPPNVDAQLGPGYLDELDRFDLLIRAPALHPRDIVAANSEHTLRKVTTVTEEFMRVCQAPIIGVTGTKGKGTTSTLVTKILEAAGKTVHLGGNIGIPPLDLLKKTINPTDWVVLELANYQLIDLHFSPRIAVCLMVAPEHLDWHKDMAEYVAAKQNLFRYQLESARAVYNRLNDYSYEVADVSPAFKVSYEVPTVDTSPQEKHGAYVDGGTIYYDDSVVCKVSDVALLGRHNLENVCAAIAATWEVIDGDKAAIYKVVTSLGSLPHRLEHIRDFEGISYYDDSYGTTPETAIAALQAIPQPKVIILGGSDKKSNYGKLAETVRASDVRTAVIIGQMGPQIKKALEQVGFTDTVDGGNTMETIIAASRKVAQKGDAVLLSTACASFGMFKDYEDRGDQFTRVVRAL